MRGSKQRRSALPIVFGSLAGATVLLAAAGLLYSGPSAAYTRISSAAEEMVKPKLDRDAYDRKLLAISHVATSSPWYEAYLLGTTTASTTEARPEWPVRAAYPKAGAILPFSRIVAYYGNFYSRAMGALGEYDPPEMLDRLRATVAEWEAADPDTPVVPAIHYIVVTAQAASGKDGMYRARMPDDQIDKALALAAEVDGIVFLDFQVGLSTLEEELPVYEEYLALPNVHLGIDPEFAMHGGAAPGTVVGWYDADDVNFAASYLANLVRTHDLPPKVLVVHRFTHEMVRNAEDIIPLPEVQIVMHMDGWGPPEKKYTTYRWIVAAEPVQFTGFKIFYKNDLKPPSSGLYTPEGVLELVPQPMYIQYQ